MSLDFASCLHIFGAAPAAVCAALRAYFDADDLERQIAVLRSGKKLSPEEERRMFHYVFRAKGKHDVLLGDGAASVFMDLPPCPDVELYARELSDLTGGTVLFFATAEWDPVECGVCQHGATVTMLVRGDARSHELSHAEMDMDALYAALPRRADTRRTSYNRISKDELPRRLEEDFGVPMTAEALDRCRRDAVRTCLFSQENLTVYDPSVPDAAARGERAQAYGLGGEEENAFCARLLAALALGFLAQAAQSALPQRIPPRGRLQLLDLLRGAPQDLPDAVRRVLEDVESGQAAAWTPAQIAELRENIL